MGAFTRGTQIIYIPDTAKGNRDHPDCETGFVASDDQESNRFVYCRYWRDGLPLDLRTKNNSEATPREALVIENTVPQRYVEEALARYVKVNDA